MIKLTFITGSAIRRIIIKDRIVTLIAAETSNQPVTINLDEIDSQKDKFQQMKLSEEDIITIKELSKLGSEDDMAKDIITDFQQTGWRLVRREG